MSKELAVRGLRATTLGGYLSALGLLRVLTRQHDPGARLSWQGDLPVLSTSLDAQGLTTWLVDQYQPSAIVSPWNSGSGFSDSGKSVEAEKTLATIESSTGGRLALLREAIAAGREVVDEGRARGFAGESMWRKECKQKVITLCRNTFPDEALPWIDVAAVLTGEDVTYNPLAGTGGNFGRQDLSATFLQHVVLTIGPAADRRSAAWADAALTGAEDVPYKRGAVGQFDPGRAGGVLASIWGEPDKQGFVNPWRTLLTCEGLLLFASAAVRRQSGEAGAAWPFSVHATPIGHPTASAGEAAKGEVWAPLWRQRATLGELESVFGEGRAQWRGAQARDGLLFALAIASLGVDRSLSAFRRFVLVERLGQSPLAVPAGDVSVTLRHDHALLAEPYTWLSRLDRKDRLPAGVSSLLRQCQQALYAAASGTDTAAMGRFVLAFGRLHEAVARSGVLRKDIRPYQPSHRREWVLPDDAPGRDEHALASALTGLSVPRTPTAVPALRPWLLRTRLAGEGTRARLVWAANPAARNDLWGATLATSLAEALRRMPPARAAEHVPMAIVEDFVDGRLDDELIADALRGLLTLGWTIPPLAAQRTATFRNPALTVLLPFFSARALHLVSTWDRDRIPFTAELEPRTDWSARLQATGPAGVVDEALLRLKLAGCRPLVRAPGTHGTDGTRLAAALLAPVSLRDRVHALVAVTAVRPAPRLIVDDDARLTGPTATATV